MRSDRSGVHGTALLAAAPVLVVAVTFLLPVGWLLRTAFSPEPGAISASATLEPLRSVLGDPFYWWVIGKTVGLGALVSIITVPLSFPIAYFLARTDSRWRNLLLGLAIAPILTSAVIRTYGWMVILGRHGVISGLLLDSGLIRRPLRIDNGLFATMIALVEIMMPYAIVSMLGGLGKIHPDLEHAARLLGASRIASFWRVTVPLSARTVLTAALLVFVLSISALVTPQLMGGGRVFVLATQIFNETTLTLDWPRAAALSLVMLALFALVMAAIRVCARRLEFGR